MTRRLGELGRGRLVWLTVATPDLSEVIFNGSSTDAGEVEEVAAEARWLRPDCRIFITDTFGKRSKR